MKTETKHTPLKHSDDCVYNEECQKSHTSVASTDLPKLTSELSKLERTAVEASEHVSSVGGSKLSLDGQTTERDSSKLTAESVLAAESQSQDSLQSTTYTETALKKDGQGKEAGLSNNGSLGTISQKTTTGSCASTVIAPGVNSASAHTKSSFTPGPWINKRNLVTNASHVIICEIYGQENKSFVELPEWEANTALIAAAPELLEALQLLLVRAEPYFPEEVGEGTDIPYAVEQARRAIAVATGSK